MPETYIGFDIGGTSIRSAIIDAEGEVLEQGQILRPETTAEIVGVLCEDVAKGGHSAVGVGCAGFVSLDGVVTNSPNIPSLVNFPLREVLEEKTGCPVVVENDAAAAAWGEACLATRAGAGSGAVSMAGVGSGAVSMAGAGSGAVSKTGLVFLGFGTGIGGGVVQDGELLRGAHGFGSEPGHLTVEPGGLRCPCGRWGCWERYASGSALRRDASVKAAKDEAPELMELADDDIDAITGEHVAQLVHAGSPVAHELLNHVALWAAIGLNTIVVLFDPELIVLGGGLSEIGEPFLNAVEGFYQDRYGPYVQDQRPKLRFALAQPNSGSIGAAFLARKSSEGKSAEA